MIKNILIELQKIKNKKISSKELKDNQKNINFDNFMILTSSVRFVKITIIIQNNIIFNSRKETMED